MNKGQFYTVLDHQLEALKSVEELEFQVYRSHTSFDQSKMDLVTDAKEKMKEFAEYLELLEKELFPEEE